jgi:hypothetical protein
MAKTLLELTQNILSAMDSDEVNSISDSVESLQVATIIAETLEAEFNNLDFPSFQKIVKLDGLSDLDHPNYLQYGSNVSGIQWLKYRDNRNNSRYKEVIYLTPTDFFDRITLVTNSGANTQEITDFSGITYFIKTNSAPTFYTSVDNNYLIFDSFDAEYEDSLHESNTFALGSSNINSVELQDDYVPPIPDDLFPLLLAEAKATCFLTVKQMPSPKSEQIARRQRSRMQNKLYKSRKAQYPYARSKYDFSRKR